MYCLMFQQFVRSLEMKQKMAKRLQVLECRLFPALSTQSKFQLVTYQLHGLKDKTINLVKMTREEPKWHEGPAQTHRTENPTLARLDFEFITETVNCQAQMQKALRQ